MPLPKRRTRWDRYTPEEREAAKKHLSEKKKMWWSEATPEQIETIKKHQQWSAQQRWDLMSSGYGLAYRESRRLEQKRVWAKRSKTERKAIFEKMLATRKARGTRTGRKKKEKSDE